MPDAGETNKYALELHRSAPYGVAVTIKTAALMLHHDLKLLTEALTGPKRCACGALDSPNHRVVCHAR